MRLKILHLSINKKGLIEIKTNRSKFNKIALEQIEREFSEFCTFRNVNMSKPPKAVEQNLNAVSYSLDIMMTPAGISEPIDIRQIVVPKSINITNLSNLTDPSSHSFVFDSLGWLIWNQINPKHFNDFVDTKYKSRWIDIDIIGQL